MLPLVLHMEGLPVEQMEVLPVVRRLRAQPALLPGPPPVPEVKVALV